MKVAYLFVTFPVLSQTFLQREIRGIAAAGIEVDVHSMWTADDAAAWGERRRRSARDHCRRVTPGVGSQGAALSAVHIEWTSTSIPAAAMPRISRCRKVCERTGKVTKR